MKLTPEAKVEAERVIGKACRAYSRRCWWADPADIEQQAWVIACEVWGQQDWPGIGMRQFGACVWVALMHRLAKYLRRQQSPVSISHGVAENRKVPGGNGERYDFAVVSIPIESERPHDAGRAEAYHVLGTGPERAAITAQAAAKLRDSLLAISGEASTMAVAVLCDGASPDVVAARYQKPVSRVAWAVRASVRKVITAADPKRDLAEVAEAVRQLTA